MAGKINDGGAAFPCPATAFATPSGMSGSPGVPGMSLRDYFASRAMESLILKTEFARHEPTMIGNDPFAQDRFALSVSAYAYADAMLAAREAK